MHKTYKGKYKIKNPAKYVGNAKDITYRSGWEKSVFIWCENNPRVKHWSSEVIIIPYICETDRKQHKYYVDLTVAWDDGTVSLIEIKPKKQLSPPKKPKRQTKRYIEEAMQYIKNQSKWKAAKKYCEYNGWKWEIWTEDVMKAKGIKIV